MVSLLDIYNINEENLITEDADYSTTPYPTNKSGKLGWKVTYQTDLHTTLKTLDTLVNRLDDLRAEQPEDPIVLGFLKETRSLKNRFSRYKRKKDKEAKVKKDGTI